MKARALRKPPELVLRGGKPAAVILDIRVYREMLERLQDVEDLRYLRRLRKKPLHFRRLDAFLIDDAARAVGILKIGHRRDVYS